MRYSKCVVCYETVGWVGLMSNFALSALKAFVGIVSGSQALVADAMYSAKDVITSALIIVGLKISKQPIDREHPYGHGKVEFVLSGAISVIFIGITGLLFFYAAESLMEGEHEAPHMIALWTAVFSIAASVFLYHYTKCVSTEINSPMVSTLSRHHQADGYSSAAVALGIIGSHYLGMPWLDTIVALFESLHLLYLGGEIFWDSFKGMMDTSVGKDVLSRIEDEAMDVEGVEDVEKLRTRKVGQELWIDMIVGVNPEHSVFEAKKIGVLIENRLVKSIQHVGVVNVHFKSLTGSLPELDVIHPPQPQLADGSGETLALSGEGKE